MSVPIPARGLIPTFPPPVSSQIPSPTPAEDHPFPGTITTSFHHLATLNLTHPILRFSFPTASAQTAFHHAFAQLRTPRDRAAFMERYYDNYEGVVDIPRLVHMDTSNHEKMARRLAEQEDERLRGEVRAMAEGDEGVARELQGSLGVEMGTEGDEEVARRLEEEERMRMQRGQRHQIGRMGAWENDRGRREYDRRMRMQQARGYAPPPSSHTPIYNNPHPNNMTALTDRFDTMNVDPTRHRRLPPQSFTAAQPSVQQRGDHSGNGYGQPVLVRSRRLHGYDGEFDDGFGRGGGGGYRNSGGYRLGSGYGGWQGGRHGGRN
ncbi:hypothetical protein PTMSG1_06288 [Pyrenophora teres f. maculata]|nr:hypothetical protein PTMSG1_06288 [Pyrenophora teres f. maculata]